MTSASCGPVGAATAGVRTVSCTATDGVGHTQTASVEFVVEYKIAAFLSPQAGATFRTGQKLAIQIALTDVAGTRIGAAEAKSLAAGCRVKASASGAQGLTSSCMKSTPPSLFTHTWATDRTGGKGAATITATVTYPGSATTTTRSTTITLT